MLHASLSAHLVNSFLELISCLNSFCPSKEMGPEWCSWKNKHNLIRLSFETGGLNGMLKTIVWDWKLIGVCSVPLLLVSNGLRPPMETYEPESLTLTKCQDISYRPPICIGKWPLWFWFCLRYFPDAKELFLWDIIHWPVHSQDGNWIHLISICNLLNSLLRLHCRKCRK